MPTTTPMRQAAHEVADIDAYRHLIVQIERLRARFHEALKAEIDRLGVTDVTSVQAFMVCFMDKEKMTVGAMGASCCHEGSTVTHNVKKLVELGYLRREPSQIDKRSVLISATCKGTALREQLNLALANHLKLMATGPISPVALAELKQPLGHLGRLWERAATLAAAGAPPS